MADEAIIDLRFGVIEKECEETKARVTVIENDIGAIDDRLSDHDKAHQSVREWRTGNGSKGAEARLQEMEDGLLYYARERIPQRLACVEADMEAVQRIADHAIQTGVQGAVNDTLDKRDKTTIAKVKAWGPYFATAVVLILGILERVLK